MNKSLLISKLLPYILALLFSAVPASADLIVQYFGPEGVTEDQFIEPLNTTLSSNFEDPNGNEVPLFWSINSSNSDVRFIRHIISIEETNALCEYWFRSDRGPTGDYLGIEHYNDAYWMADCFFVDGAENGSDNFILLYAMDLERIVGVVQYALNDAISIDQPARMLAYALDLEGLTFEQGVAAIQAVPEPSTYAMLLAGAALVGTFIIRRRR